MLNYMLKEIKVINCGRGSGECKNTVCKINDKKIKNCLFIAHIYERIFELYLAQFRSKEQNYG